MTVSEYSELTRVIGILETADDFGEVDAGLPRGRSPEDPGHAARPMPVECGFQIESRYLVRFRIDRLRPLVGDELEGP